MDGRDLNLKALKKDFLWVATLFDNVLPKCEFIKKKFLDLYLVVMRVTDFDTALKLINEHEFGNGTAIFTRDGYTARTFATSASGYGRRLIFRFRFQLLITVLVAGSVLCLVIFICMARKACNFYTKLKTITQRWLKDNKGTEFSMPTH